MPTEMTMRDHFAAAALTGLLTSDDVGEESNAFGQVICQSAYLWAAAMLRERGNHIADAGKMVETPTTHDAAPAARASVESVAPQPTTRGDSDRTDKAAPRPSEGTGDTPATHATRGEGSERRECTEPVAWEVFLPGAGTYAIHSFRWEAAAIAHALLFNEGTIAAVCPLFRQPQPTLTDAEREAIKRGMTLTFTLTPAERAVFHGLLERLG